MDDNKKKRYDPNDYLYCSARIRSLETRLADNTLLQRMTEARNENDAFALLCEKGLFTDKADPDKAFDDFLAENFALIRSISPDSAVVDLAALPYDCHNIKTAVKCSIMERSPQEMYYSFGSVPTDVIDRAIAERSYSELPAHMAKAIPEAFDTYAKTKDPQLIDALIDSACYEDMYDTASSIGDPLFVDWVNIKSDLANILMTIRIIHMGGEYDRAYLERMLVPYGTIDNSLLIDTLYDGEAGIWSRISNTRYFTICRILENDPELTLSTIERECENFALGFIKDSDRYTISGAVVVFGYLIACECMVKNARIIIASKKAGKDTGVIKERMRNSYV